MTLYSVAGVRRVAKLAVTSGVAASWASAFRFVGRLRHQRVPRWSSAGDCRVLLVAPHPDDEVYGCGGTLLRHLAEGDRVVVSVATDGRRSRALGVPPAQTAQIRRREAVDAVGELGAELRWLGLPEGDWRPGDLAPLLAEILDDERPDIVYAPSRVDFHPEHLRVAAEVSEALSGQGKDDLLVRIYGVQVPLTPRLANLVTPMAKQEGRWRAALDRHVSQRGSLRSAVRLRRYAAGLHRAGMLAEEFWEVSSATYRTLHTHDVFEGIADSTPFRGIRDLPFSDPLAYLVGGRERSRLHRLAQSGSPREGRKLGERGSAWGSSIP